MHWQAKCWGTKCNILTFGAPDHPSVNVQLDFATLQPQIFSMSHLKIAHVSLCFYLLFTSTVLSQDVHFLGDLKTGDQSINVLSVKTFHDKLLLLIDHPSHGIELFTYDEGEGLTLVKDIYPGRSNLPPWGRASVSLEQICQPLGDDLIFLANDGEDGSELWILHKDLTVEPLTDLTDGNLARPIAREFEVFDDRLFFVADGSNGLELWHTEGNPGSVQLLKDINPNGSSDAQLLKAWGGFLYFLANDGETGLEWWRTDGTSEGTEIFHQFKSGVEGIGPVNGEISQTMATDKHLYLVINDHLWRTDGEIVEFLYDVSTLHDREKFASYDSTVLAVKNFASSANLLLTTPSSIDTIPLEVSSTAILNVFVVGQSNTHVLVFGITPHSNFKIVSFDKQTHILTDVNSGDLPMNSFATSSLVFWNNFNRVSTSDGTVEGTHLVTPSLGSPRFLAGQKDDLYLNAWQAGIRGLWKYDPSQNVFYSVGPLLQSNASLSIWKMVEHNDHVYFLADGGGGQDLWRIDGNAVIDPSPAPVIKSLISSELIDLISSNNALYFNSADSLSTPSLSYLQGSDPTILDLPYDSLPISSAWGFVELGARILLKANHPGFGITPWSLSTSDHELQPLAPEGSRLTLSSDYVVVGSMAFFAGATENEGLELCTTDGLSTQVIDLREGQGSSSPTLLTAVGDKLYFSAQDENDEYEIFVSQGSLETTKKVVDLSSNLQARQSHLTASGDKLFFVAETAESGSELWVTQGTTENTSQLSEFTAAGSPLIGTVRAFRGGVLFAADNGNHGHELWFSDGTPDGTEMIGDIWTGPGSSTPGDIIVIDTTAFLTANDGASGEELWITHGSIESTRLLADIAPGSAASSPAQFFHFKSANRLLFTAFHPSHGRELYSVSLDGLSTSVHNARVHSDLAIYPNPATDRISVTTTTRRIEKIDLFDLSGRQIKSATKAEVSAGSVDLSLLDQPILFVAIQYKDGAMETRTVLKMR